MSLRKLKHHEKKLLKKVDFFDFKCANSQHEAMIMRKYGVDSRETYHKYRILGQQIEKIVHELKHLKDDDEFRLRTTKLLLQKLKYLGVLTEGVALRELDQLSTASILRRRLCFILKHNKMANDLEHAKQIIKQGHIRVGKTIISDPDFLVPPHMEDVVTWKVTSKYRAAVKKYRDKTDDFEENAM